MLRTGPASASPPNQEFRSARRAAVRSTFGRAALVAGLLFTLAACGGGGGGGSFDGQTPPSAPPPSNTPPAPTYAIGTGIGSSFQNGVLTASQTTLNAGETTTIRANAVVTNSNNDPIGEPGDLSVRFRSICAASGRANFGDGVFSNSGLVTVPYTNNGCEGEDTVTATLLNGGTTIGSATMKLTMLTAEVLTVSFVSATHEQLSLAGIGGNESTELTFVVAGPQGVPIAGKLVRFSISTPVGGASILPGRETGITDQNGQVRTALNSGTVAGPVNVLAVHQESGKQGLSSDIIISTGVPAANRFSLSYGPFNPVGAWNTDGIEVNLSIIASDAFGNNPTDGTRVSFVSPEGGNVQSSCQLVNGACSVVWRSTAPRPADMRVEVIAYTDGAEAFVDRNGNSVYDAADGAIVDQGEPYADHNENNRYDIGEFFFDTNRNGVRDPGNGLWDGPCLDKVNPAAVCAGNGTVTIYDTVTIVMSTDFARLRSLGDFPEPGNPINIQQGSAVSLFGLQVADSTLAADALGGNPLPVGTTMAFTVEGPGVQTQGLTSYVVPNTTRPTSNLGIVLIANAVEPPAQLPVNTRLLLTVTVPNRQIQQVSWPIVVGP
jgi:hypothetical protein